MGAKHQSQTSWKKKKIWNKNDCQHFKTRSKHIKGSNERYLLCTTKQHAKKKKNANLVSSKHWTQNNIVQPKTNKLNGLALHQFVKKKINV